VRLSFANTRRHRSPPTGHDAQCPLEPPRRDTISYRDDFTSTRFRIDTGPSDSSRCHRAGQPDELSARGVETWHELAVRGNRRAVANREPAKRSRRKRSRGDRVVPTLAVHAARGRAARGHGGPRAGGSRRRRAQEGARLARGRSANHLAKAIHAEGHERGAPRGTLARRAVHWRNRGWLYTPAQVIGRARYAIISGPSRRGCVRCSRGDVRAPGEVLTGKPTAQGLCDP
jgi:hypothetical protein